MNRTIAYILAALMLGSTFFAEGKSRQKEDPDDIIEIRIEERAAKLVMNSMCKVTYIQSPRNRVQLIGAAFTSCLKGVKVNNATIYLNEQTNMVDEVRIYAPGVTVFVLNGMGELHCADFNGPSLNINLNGMTDVDFDNVNVEMLSLNANGTSDFECKKLKADRADINQNGMCSVRFLKLKATTLDASSNGMGDIECKDVDVKRTKLSVNGQATIDVEGTTDTATLILSGMGDINAKFLKARYVKKIDNREEWFKD